MFCWVGGLKMVLITLVCATLDSRHLFEHGLSGPPDVWDEDEALEDDDDDAVEEQRREQVLVDGDTLHAEHSRNARRGRKRKRR